MTYNRVAAALVLLATSLSSFRTARKPNEGPLAEVRGTITDSLYNGRLQHIRVMFLQDKRQYRTETGASGTYSMRLRPGIYTMGVSYPGFCEVRRGAFVVKRGAVIEFDFRLTVCPSDLAGKYDYAELNPAPASGLRPLILFGEAITDRDSTRYTGPVIPRVLPVDKGTQPEPGQYGRAILVQDRYPVVLTYNLLTIRCEELTYDSTKNLVIGTGKVEVLKGNSIQKGTRVEVFLQGLEPNIDLASQ